MALVKYGGGIVQQSGSIAGNTFARNRFGNYVRARTKPINPRSSRQSAARIAIMYLAEQWRESPMTDAIRLSWETYAQSVSWLNKLGESVTLTGFNMFMRANCALLRAGGTVVTAGPTDLGLPAGDPTMVVSLVSEATQDVTLTFDDAMDWAGEDDAYVILEMGQPQNVTRNFFNGPWRFYAALEGNTAVPITSPELLLGGDAYTMIETQKVFWRASIIRADGRMTTKFMLPSTIVVA